MAFWTNAKESPKQNHRWHASFGGVGDIWWTLKSVTKPQYEVTMVEHQYLNHTFKFPGGVKWQDITLKFADVSKPIDVGHSLHSLVELSGYTVPQRSDQRSTVCKQKFVKNLQDLVITQIDCDEKIIEQWVVKNPQIKNMNYESELSYNNYEITTVSMIITYDYAHLRNDANGRLLFS